MRGDFDRHQEYFCFYTNLSASDKRVCLHNRTVFGFDEEVLSAAPPELLVSLTAHIVFTSFPFSVNVTSCSMRHAAAVAQAPAFAAPRRLGTRFSGGESLVLQHFLLTLDDWATSADGSLLEGGFISAWFIMADLIPDQSDPLQQHRKLGMQTILR